MNDRDREIVHPEPVRLEDLAIPLAGPPIRRNSGNGDSLAKFRERKWGNPAD